MWLTSRIDPKHARLGEHSDLSSQILISVGMDSDERLFSCLLYFGSRDRRYACANVSGNLSYFFRRCDNRGCTRADFVFPRELNKIATPAFYRTRYRMRLTLLTRDEIIIVSSNIRRRGVEIYLGLLLSRLLSAPLDKKLDYHVQFSATN